MDGDSHTWMILSLIVLVIFSAYFSATETAFSSLNRIRPAPNERGGFRREAAAPVLCGMPVFLPKSWSQCQIDKSVLKCYLENMLRRVVTFRKAWPPDGKLNSRADCYTFGALPAGRQARL